MKKYSSKTVQYIVGSVTMLCVTNALELSPFHKEIEPNLFGVIVFLIAGLAVIFIGDYFQKKPCRINGESVDLEGIEMDIKDDELRVVMNSEVVDEESLKSFRKLEELFEQYQDLVKKHHGENVPDTPRDV